MKLVTVDQGFDKHNRKRIKSENMDITIFKVNDDFFACESKCPHRGGPLFLARNHGDNSITCISHNIRFSLTDGKVIHNPIPESMGDYAVCGNLKIYRCEKEGSNIVVQTE
ncbi:Rieske (2Fe-2S) protein [Caldiplasma sukawensis]